MEWYKKVNPVRALLTEMIDHIRSQKRVSPYSGWWIMESIESFNGERLAYGQGIFLKWFSTNAFGGTLYRNTPVGGVSHTDEPGLPGVNNSSVYFGLWASGKNLAICAWYSRSTGVFQAVGDPFVTR